MRDSTERDLAVADELGHMADARIKELEADNKRLREELHRAENDAEVETRRGDNWERRAKQLGRDNEALELQCNGLRGKASELHNRIGERNERIVELQSRLSEVTKERDDLQSERLELWFFLTRRPASQVSHAELIAIHKDMATERDDLRDELEKIKGAGVP